MRTTITLDEDTSAAVERLRRDRGIGLSEAVNELIRAGLRVRRTPVPFRQRSCRLGLRIDVTNVAEAIELLEAGDSR